ncbi:Rossmann-like and DUF2520 domain-containing protein [Flavobacterium sp.]|jgi:predicted short-subunit dehydrogenase-like oxidoreductase (DUF2520 family)|uniref:Rossmann-like and DUF2520 domain-containing protein n=1 Tax=Flavobacterium sp. TaxID=239 RepID=UPI0037C1ADBC
MISVSIIGSGNVAQHLISAFEKADGIELVQVYLRNPNSITSISKSIAFTQNFNELQPVDLFIIAVSDDAIVSVSEQIPFINHLVVHTSGSVAMESLSNSNRKGVFYPLQTLSKTKEINFKEVPLCLEAENKSDMKMLHEVASAISNNVYEIDSNQRKSLHIAAVFVNNFANHLFQIGNDICEENGISFDILKPLITETANKLNTLSPKEAQTGPAKRGDTSTINKHLDFLTDPNQKEIYKILTKSIIDNGKL